MLFLLDDMLRFSADDGGAGGGSDTGAGNDDGGGLEQRILEAFQGLAQREGGRDAAGIVLLQENRDYRRQIRELEDRVADLQGQLPGDDAVLLQGEDVQQWTSYRELGTPEEIRQQREQVAALERRQVLADAAKAAGYKVPVLERLAGDGLAIEMRDAEDGRVAYVAPAEGEAVPLADYAAANWADFMPALVAEQGSPQRARPAFQQTPAGDESPPDAVGAFIQQREEQQKKIRGPLDTVAPPDKE